MWPLRKPFKIYLEFLTQKMASVATHNFLMVSINGLEALL